MKDEFNGYFDSLVEDVMVNMKKYSESVKQLEDLLEMEKETLVIKRKVATFSLDYDDDLVINLIGSPPKSTGYPYIYHPYNDYRENLVSRLLWRGI